MSNVSNQLSPAEGIKVINYSLRCFALSFGGLIPVLGVPFIIQSFSCYRQARAISKGRWNPAQRHLAWGSVIASTGLLITLGLVIFFVCLFLKLFPWQYEPQ
jgi:hypothetical protein